MAKKVWTLDDAPNQKGRVFIVTGGNSGIGYETVKGLVKKEATVIMASRNMEKAKKAKETIESEIPSADITIMQLDLASLKSIDDFAEIFNSKYDRLDVLINKAGIMFTKYGLTKDGFEQQNGVNHLGHFALTAKLYDLIKNTENSRIVNVSSIAHKFGKIDIDNYLFENKKGYSKARSYGRSKLSNLLFTFEMNRRFENHNVDIKVYAAHPGGSQTKLTRHIKGFISKLFNIISQSAEKGALPTLRAALDEDAPSGTFYGPSGLFEIRGNPVPVKPWKKAKDVKTAKELWLLSETLTKHLFTVD